MSKHTHLIDPPDLSWLLLSCLHEHLAPGTAWSNAVCPVVPASHTPMLAATHTHTRIHTCVHTHDSHVTVSRWHKGRAVPGKRKHKQCTITSLRHDNEPDTCIPICTQQDHQQLIRVTQWHYLVKAENSYALSCHQHQQAEYGIRLQLHGNNHSPVTPVYLSY